MINFLKKANTAITIITTVYAVTKFMFNTFKKYEAKHRIQTTERTDEGRVRGEHESLEEVGQR